MTENVLDEPVWGADAIASVIKRTRRQTFYMLSSGALPAKKVGGRWVAIPSRLREYLTDSQAAKA